MLCLNTTETRRGLIVYNAPDIAAPPAFHTQDVQHMYTAVLMPLLIADTKVSKCFEALSTNPFFTHS